MSSHPNKMGGKLRIGEKSAKREREKGKGRYEGKGMWGKKFRSVCGKALKEIPRNTVIPGGTNTKKKQWGSERERWKNAESYLVSNFGTSTPLEKDRSLWVTLYPRSEGREGREGGCRHKSYCYHGRTISP